MNEVNQSTALTGLSPSDPRFATQVKSLVKRVSWELGVLMAAIAGPYPSRGMNRHLARRSLLLMLMML